ncbi:MAG TPA: HD domain-containing phosphohydrolase, partial [Polyangiaceae bacterium]|nr:HD domain-containing phosphohydrolase [Polyangiaceae bacterium]
LSPRARERAPAGAAVRSHPTLAPVGGKGEARRSLSPSTTASDPPPEETLGPRAVPAEMERLGRLELLHRISLALSSEKNRERLIETILIEAQTLCNADGGTLYLKNDREQLRFAILRNDSLKLALGGTTGQAIDLPPIPIRDPMTGKPNHANVASFYACTQKSINIEDAYTAVGFDFSGMMAFDQRHGYRSMSFLTIPLQNSEGLVLGVLQLINARNRETGRVQRFGAEDQHIVEALASHAGIAIDNQNLLEDQKRLLESFIVMLAGAIDAESPYTGAHCERVPVLAEMLTRSLCETESGPFAGFRLNAEEWYELRIAAWLHDCGKVATPTHVMDKATKLERVHDRIEGVRTRFEVLKRDAQIALLESIRERPAGRQHLENEYAERIAELEAELALLARSNIGGEFLSEEHRRRIREIARRSYVQAGQSVPLLSQDEVDNLCISRGTLTNAERLLINSHMVQTLRMLEALPFPRQLRRVPEYAGGHHERMDGNGYPRGLFAGDMSIPARVLAIADVFEALTATDRPYKPGKKLSEAMQIMGAMKRDNHLDPDLLDHFVSSGVYRRYAERYLGPELIDDVDEAALLAIVPKPFDLPPEELRKQRWQSFLPQYQELGARRVNGLPRPPASTGTSRSTST